VALLIADGRAAISASVCDESFRLGYADVVHAILVKTAAADRTAEMLSGLGHGLWTAANSGYTDVVARVLADPDQRIDPALGENGPLRAAVARGHADMVRLLIRDSRVDPSSDRNAALRFAARRGDVGLVDALLAEDLTGGDWHTVMHTAVTYEHDAVVVRVLRDTRVPFTALLLDTLVASYGNAGASTDASYPTHELPARVVDALACKTYHMPAALAHVETRRRVTSGALDDLVRRRLVCRDVVYSYVSEFTTGSSRRA
jgi:hypothetical protein